MRRHANLGLRVAQRFQRLDHAQHIAGIGPETLLLVTCGGEFVGPPLGYANNDFVFAVPTGPVAEVPAP